MSDGAVMTPGVREELGEAAPSSSFSSSSRGRPAKEESPDGKKDHRDFADKVECPLCGEEFAQDSLKPSDTRGDKSGHLKALEHHGEEHPEKEFQGVKKVEE